MFITRRVFNRLALMVGGAKIFLWNAPQAAWAQTTSALALQPFAAQTKRLIEALQFIGEPLAQEEVSAFNAACNSSDEAEGVAKIQQILDQHALLHVEIESQDRVKRAQDRVTMTRGHAKAELVEQGWRAFLIKVSNHAADTTALTVVCPQSLPTGRVSVGTVIGILDWNQAWKAVDVPEAEDRWIVVDTWDKPPLEKKLSGLPIEYRILEVYSRDRGQREASFRAITGAGRQNERSPADFFRQTHVSFDCLPTSDLKLRIQDVDGAPTTAALLITDRLGRVYPEQSKRGLPDLWFERQVYRRDGETIRLPAGTYKVSYGRGPEYLRKQTTITVGADNSTPASFSLERWVRPEQFGYYSGDTHIHAAGCSHYESPTQGVTPEVMYRQMQGEALDIGDTLTWVGGFEYQRRFFTGHALQIDHATEKLVQASPSSHPAVDDDTPILRYDLEVSGFPSSHCGHLVLLRLKDMHYPGTAPYLLSDWPSWNLPILKWAKEQGAVVGYGHSGLGMVVDSDELPNYLIPPYDGSGANEYIVDVTHNLVDFISGCNTPPHAELNVWYHTLNCGYRTKFAGETDFPCITHERVGGGRSYVKLGARPMGDHGYSDWISGLKAGHSYTADGRSHIFDFTVEHKEAVPAGGELSIEKGAVTKISAQVCARLEPTISRQTEEMRAAASYESPRWHLERARIGETRKVPVELIVNGYAVQRSEIEADGTLQTVRFELPIEQSSWIALRILPSSHTNPVFVLINKMPIRASKASAEWCRKGVDACWAQKSRRIRPAEIDAAKVAYNHARAVYEQIMRESQA